ncbi:MAG: dUTP diphosphatase [Epsilonproteobacteria bacterium]|nr:MAG: dUTP diphosphatase [Campylobacterota bacterium]
MAIQFKLTELAESLKKTHDIDVTPRRMSLGDVGWDLSACLTNPLKIYPGEVYKVPTGVCIWLGESLQEQTDGDCAYAGLYLPRSSAKGLVLENTVGLLDSSYQKESFCKWRNISDNIVILNPGDRMAQLVVFGADITQWEEVEEFHKDTDRGHGDGSSGR